jgi:hypothetical protein
MPLASEVSNLTMVGLHTTAPKVFWRGEEVPGVESIKINNESGDVGVKLKVNGTADAVYMELVSAGIHVKKVN